MFMSEHIRGPDSVSNDRADQIQQAWIRERPGTPVSSIGVFTRIWWITKLLDEDRRQTMLRLEMDVGTRDLLSTLRRAGPPYRLSPSELVRHSAVSAGAVSGRIARAERDGTVIRTKSTTDGRAALVELTERGHHQIEQAVDDLLRHEERLLDGLTGEQREQLAGLLRLLLADLPDRMTQNR